MTNQENQIKLLKKYNIDNYVVDDDKITINGDLYLSSLTSVDKEFLKDTTINGNLYLSSLTSADKEFLKDTTINGGLDLNSLTSVDKEFLKDTTINGGLYLNSLTSADKEFLKDTTISGGLYLNSLTSADNEFLKDNVNQLKEGYNKEKGYCYFDGELSKVLSVKKTRGYTIYNTPFGYIAGKDDKTAHGKTIKKAINDLEFKFIAEKLKTEPINEDTVITDSYYRIITGACSQGISDWKKRNNITKEKIKAKELLPILKRTNAFGLDAFKKLIAF